MKQDLEDIYWINEILEGKTEIYRSLVDKYKNSVFSLVLGMLKNREEAEEAAQDIFLKVYKALSQFKKESKFSTWLYRIAYNECLSLLRKRKKVSVSLNSMHELQADINDDGERWQDHELKSAALHEALSKLQDNERGLIHFYYFENMPVSEISGITGLSVSNVKIRLFRIRKQLYEELFPFINNLAEE